MTLAQLNSLNIQVTLNNHELTIKHSPTKYYPGKKIGVFSCNDVDEDSLLTSFTLSTQDTEPVTVTHSGLNNTLYYLQEINTENCPIGDATATKNFLGQTK